MCAPWDEANAQRPVADELLRIVMRGEEKEDRARRHKDPSGVRISRRLPIWMG
jgi:hypothetical protein